VGKIRRQNRMCGQDQQPRDEKLRGEEEIEISCCCFACFDQAVTYDVSNQICEPFSLLATQ
jgi:hypothetical protein